MTRTCTFAEGQIVHWPAAPLGWAQVAELRRTCVRLVYRCRTGRTRRPIVRATAIAELDRRGDPLLPLTNPLGRAVVKRSKTFAMLDKSEISQ